MLKRMKRHLLPLLAEPCGETPAWKLILTSPPPRIYRVDVIDVARDISRDILITH